MPVEAEDAGNPARRVLAIREEMKFELGVLHDRVNALVSAEAFLTISFTMSLAYSGEGLSGRFLIAPALALVGFLLAVLAWPGVRSGVEIIVEWNQLLIVTLDEARKDPRFVWRASDAVSGNVKTHGQHRKALLFARLVPMVFAAAWVVLAAIVLTRPLLRS